MNFEEFKKLSEIKKIKYLSRTYGDQELYENIRKAFLEKFKCEKIVRVVVGGYGIGEVPAIIVTQKKGEQRLVLPKSFLGLPVVRKNK